MSLSLTNEPSPLPHAMDDPERLRSFASIQLIAFDLDGTLIGQTSQKLGQRLADLLLTISRSHVIVTLATGRSLTGVKEVLGQLDLLNKVPLILYNGSVVIRPDRQALVAIQSMSKLAVKEILELGITFSNISIFVYAVDSDAPLMGGATTTEAVYCSVSKPSSFLDFNGMHVRSINDLNLDVEKIVAALVEIDDVKTRDVFLDRLRKISGISITSSGGKYIEIRPLNSSKAVGLEKLINQLGIDKKNVLAMGDGDNDVELLEWAEISVCVNSSSLAARKASKFYSDHGAGEAAIDLLEIVRRAKRLFKGDRRHGANSTN